MARQLLWDLTADHDHLDKTVGVDDTTPLGEFARAAQVLQALGHILVLHYDREQGLLQVRSLPDTIGK